MAKKKAKPLATDLPTTPARTLPPPKHARMTTPADAVRIRMYRQGLGDCFLLAFPTKDPAEPFYVMIDCGVILGTEKPGDIMKVVAEDIRAATGGRIDVVLGTHQHWDHLSGFLQAREVFEQIEIGEAWLAWTENPADKVADALRKQRVKLTKALRLAAAQLDRRPGLGERVRGLTDFFGAGPGPAALAGAGLGAAGGSSNDTDAALDFLKDRAKRVRYFRPGQKPVPLEGVTGGARAFVLGPPRDDKLFHSDPSAKEKAGNVVYSLAGSVGLNTAFLAAAVDPKDLGDDPDLDDLRAAELARPFDACYHIYAASADDTARRPPGDALAKRSGCVATRGDREFFRARYYHQPPAQGKPTADDASWRRIDGEWLEVAAELALKLDNDTNNTSLALAIELPNRAVLLFPADAQVGNWTSWNDHTFDAGDGQKVTAKDLLARTVFYKVGHHGSHNATLRVGGLEDMGGDLVAMLPVDQAMATKKRWGHMPLEGLVKALKAHTGGRLMRLDSGLPADADREPTLTQKAWKDFRAATKTSNHLYLEYACPCA